jgi:hypothetical protein
MENAGMTKVRFRVDLIDNELIELSEDEIVTSFDTYGEQLCAQEALEGAVVVQAPRIADLIIEDELWVIVQNLCFTGVVTLLEERPEVLHYRYFHHDGDLVLIPSTRFIKIMGDEVPTNTYEAAELLPALYRCGERYLALRQRLVDAGHEDSDLERMYELQEKTRRTLQAHAML